MPDSSAFGTASVPVIGPLAAQMDKIVQNAASAAADNSKIEKSAKDFESILLSTWLQQAEQTFASLPGGDDDEDADAGKEQLQGIAMQSLGMAMTKAGGIGIAGMIARQLHKAEDAHQANAAGGHPALRK